MRVYSRAAVDKVVEQRQRLNLRDILRLGAGFDKARNAGGGEGGDQRIAILVKLIVQQMRVCIK